MARTLPIRLRTIAAAVVVVATGLIIWNAYQSIINTTEPTSGTLPVISADTKPFRVLPDNPGGADIPNQGSRLFNVLNAENADELALSGVKVDKEEGEPDTIASVGGSRGFELPKIPEPKRESLYGELETLRDRQEIEDDPEITVMEDESREELKEKLQSVIEHAEDEQEAEVVVDENNENVVVDEDEPTGDVANNSDVVIPLPSQKPLSRAKKNSVSPSSSPESPTSPPIAQEQKQKEFSVDRILSKNAPSGTHYIQLASLKSEADAKQAYGRIRDDFPKLVQGVSVVFPKADLGSRGTFYRIQIGPLSAAEAQKRCNDYRASAGGGTCLVVSR
tara:strand:+ start:633 stop:1637 length:1005 start_codon:yes stop_codon:yes gene_type:complete